MAAAYYAVRKGRQAGVYLTWSDCEPLVRGFSGAEYKKFPTREDAEAYVNGLEPKKRKHTEVPADVKRLCATPSGYTVVYTDGSALGNGTKDARAGIGVFWGAGDPRNVSEPLRDLRATNQRAELTAALRALKDGRDVASLEIRTDSRYTINCATEWLPRWLANGFCTFDGKAAKNEDLIRAISTELDKRAADGRSVRWTYVPAHSGHAGNEAADRLARDGAERDV